MPNIDSQDPALNAKAEAYFSAEKLGKTDHARDYEEAVFKRYMSDSLTVANGLMFNTNWSKKHGLNVTQGHSTAKQLAQGLQYVDPKGRPFDEQYFKDKLAAYITAMEAPGGDLSKFGDPVFGPAGTINESWVCANIAEIYYQADSLKDFYMWAARAILTGHEVMGSLLDVVIELMEQGIESPYEWANSQPKWWIPANA